MGGKCPHRKVKKRRFSHKTARRTKFQLKGDDAVYEELMKLAKAEGGEEKQLSLDEDLPGMGQFYCLHCDRYFATAEVRDEHFKTKLHKKRPLKPRPLCIEGKELFSEDSWSLEELQEDLEVKGGSSSCQPYAFYMFDGMPQFFWAVIYI